MELNNHEQIIKEKMQSFRPEPDKDALWESLSQYVPQEPQKKKKRLWFFLVFLSLTGLVVLLLMPGNQKNEKIPFKNKSNNTGTINETKKIVDGKINKGIAETKIETIGINAKTEMQKKAKKYSHSTIEISKNPIVFALNKANQEENNASKSHEQFVEKSIVLNNHSQIEMTKRESINTLENLSNKLNLLYTNEVVSLNPTITIENFPKNKYLNYFAWNVGVGIGKVDHSYDPGNTGSEVFTKYFESDTKPSWNIDIGMSYHFAKRVYICSGIQFEQLVTRLHPKWDRIRDEQNPYYNGLTQRVQSKLEYEAIGHNYQNVLDIPLSIGLRTVETRVLSLSLEAGYVLNIFTYSKGVIVDEKFKLHYYTNTSGNPYGNFGGAWLLSAKLDYKINDNVGFYLNPVFSKRSINYEFSGYKFKEKYSNFDIKVGIRCKI